MRVGMLCSNYLPHPGGLEVMVQHLAKGLAKNNEVVLVTSAFDGAIGETIEHGITVHRVPAVHVTERFGIPYPVPFGRELRTALRAVRACDVLHTHGALYAISIQAALLARRCKIPLVLTEHVGFVQYSSHVVNAIQSLAWRAVGNNVVRTARALTTLNTRVQSWLKARYPGREVHFIGNGVDTALFSPRDAEERSAIRRDLGLPCDRPLVLCVARDSEKKNLDAVLRIPRDNFHLVVCGAKRGLQRDHMTDLGVVPYATMPRLFACADVLIHPATGEGFPLAVQEALASGVATALLWDDGYAASLDARVVAAYDSIEHVDSTLMRLLAEECWRSELAAAGRQWAVDQWSWNATVSAYEGLYADLRAR